MMHVVILGNGISGITAARFLRKLGDHQITVVSSETEFFYSRTALMYIYMGHMRFEDTKPYEDWFWKKNRINLRNAHIQSIDFSGKKLIPASGESISYDKLILATGSASNKFGWSGQDLQRVHGLYSYQDLEAMEKYSAGLKRAVIVGGGLIGIEMAEMFHSRHIPVTMLVREKNYWNNVLPAEESRMVSRHILEHGIDLRLSEELKEIHDNGQGEACAITTKSGAKIDCGFVGLTAGVHPNIHFLKDDALEIDRGILVDKNLQTNLEDVYAIGDCAQQREPLPGRRSIEAIWYTGRMMGETVAHNIMGNPTAYDPGIWFNSAKFLDIEYQVYGQAPNRLPDEMDTLYWEHSDGKASIRINYHKYQGQVLGFNLMGIRYRHEVCEKWIRDKRPVEEVLQDLGLANFDPEFFEEYEEKMIELYNQKTGKKLQLKSKRGLSKVLSFLKT
ncbi:MAG: FAD-dependent oxidoreductase [Saprospiraceae bacterium]|nr:FAD-dependent oxidoreductase [Saprospiraceae bacterium]